MDHGGWQGSNPYWLKIITAEENVGIDLDQPGWMRAYAPYLRVPGQWILVHKALGHEALIVNVVEGDQPFYAARHVALASSGGSNEIIAYGIGKKRPDGIAEHLWILPTGTVCGGDDVDALGVLMVKRMGPR